MTFTAEQIAALKAKLDPAHVSARTQSGRKLSYIEGWHAIAEANRIFGFDGWHRETIELREVRAAELLTITDKYGNEKDQWRVGYMAKVRITVGTVVREGTGFGSGAMGDLGEAVESAIKEAETDAMKRALMTFGNPFGLALYDKSQANVGSDDAPAPPAAKSSASLKREGSWEALKAKLDNDFADCHSSVALAKLRADYRQEARDAGWPKAWLDALAEEFAALEKALEQVELIEAG